jgi:hypothetical protein
MSGITEHKMSKIAFFCCGHVLPEFPFPGDKRLAIYVSIIQRGNVQRQSVKIEHVAETRIPSKFWI